jgi:hypothetical protein
MPAMPRTRAAWSVVTSAMYAWAVGATAAMAVPKPMPRNRTKSRNSAVPVTMPRMPRSASNANNAVVVVASANAATSTGLRPHDWLRRPHIWLVTTIIRAETLIMTPTCHSARPIWRDSGAMIGFSDI